MTQTLIQALQCPQCYEHRSGPYTVIETHISWILLTGPYAYKIKKPLNLGFLDFTGLEARRFYCYEELRLNKRLAPELYCDVVAITGSPEHPVITAAGATAGSAIEFAVKMIQFEQKDRLDHVLERRELTTAHLDQLARTLAGFHQEAAVATDKMPFGTPQRLYQPIQECFDQLDKLLTTAERRPLDRIQSWCQETFRQLTPLMTERKQNGRIRECHGDVHLANMILRNGQVTLFDCIEFSENLRWIDVISEVAFITMDLIDRQAAGFAARLLNRYLGVTGDYGGLPLLCFYQVYRALVRAKIAGIRCQQTDPDRAEAQAARRECLGYLQLALGFTEPPTPRLWITHGLSGTGKTVLSEELAAATGAIHLRSDIERKRLFGLRADAVSTVAQKTQLYGEAMTRRVYGELASLATTIIKAGRTVLVDATFLKRWQRDIFVERAERFNIPLTILQLEAPLELLQQRIQERQAKQTDASEADLRVLAWQQENLEPLDKQEQILCLPIRSDKDRDIAGLAKKLQQ